MSEPVSAADLAAAFRRLNGRRSKDGARKTRVGLRVFDSQKEAARFCELRLLEQAGAITDLDCQVRFRLTAHGQSICQWVADFVYTEGGHLVVEDVKGHRTPVYRLKKKLFEAQYGRRIRET